MLNIARYCWKAGLCPTPYALPVIDETVPVLVTKYFPHELLIGSDAISQGKRKIDYRTSVGQHFSITPYTDFISLYSLLLRAVATLALMPSWRGIQTCWARTCPALVTAIRFPSPSILDVKRNESSTVLGIILYTICLQLHIILYNYCIYLCT